jgi:hypothetical protein
MVVIFNAGQGLDNFCYINNGQSYYLDLDSRTFRISRFEATKWITDEYSFPGDVERKFLSEGRSFVIGTNFVVFFFSDGALRFEIPTKTFRDIDYLELPDKKVWGVFQTANYFYLEYVNADTITRSGYLQQAFYLNTIDCREYPNPGHWLPVFGDNNVIRSSNGEFRDIGLFSAVRPGIEYLSIFDTDKEFYQDVNGQRYIKDGQNALPTRSSWVFWNSGVRYSIVLGNLYVAIGTTFRYSMNFTNIERVYVDSTYIYLTYDSTKILAISKFNAHYSYLDVEGSEILGDLCQDLNTENIIFVNGPGLPSRDKGLVKFSVIYDRFDFIESLPQLTKVYLINSSGRTMSRKFVQWVPREMTEEELFSIVSDTTLDNYVIFDPDTGMFL